MTDKAYIARFIYAAQAASEAGKGRWELSNILDSYSGYSVKPEYELRAINWIQKHPEAGYTYSVIRDGDQNGYASFIVYFQFKLNGRRKQMSFHNPARRCPYLKRYVKNSLKTAWTEKLDESHNIAIELWEEYHDQW